MSVTGVHYSFSPPILTGRLLSDSIASLAVTHVIVDPGKRQALLTPSAAGAAAALSARRHPPTA